MQASTDSFQVLIVGAGPVGLTLAIDLGRRGIRCLLIEREQAPRQLPKMERCNARSMEIFRRLGLAERIRAAGYPGDATMDVMVATRLCDPPLLHLRYPTADEQKARIDMSRDGSQPLEAYQVVSQYTLEPLLRREAESTANVVVRYGWELTSFEQDQSGVDAVVEDTDGKMQRFRAEFMVGCDGGRSTVRKTLGIPLRGRGNLAQITQVFFKSEQLLERVPIGRARHYYMADENSAAIIGQDDFRHFCYNTRLPADADLEGALRKAIGVEVDLTVLAISAWKQHLLVAERYRERRVLLAGDACHLVVPLGGLGMNTGIGDATDLAWKLAAVLSGWGGPGLLDTYETERRPVGLRNTEASGYATAGLREWRSAYSPAIRNDDDEGGAIRARIADLASVLQRRTHEMTGVELGYRYRSAILAEEQEVDPTEANRLVYRPTASPGSRLPHVWLEDGRAVQDVLAPQFTLLRIGSEAADTTALERAFHDEGIPLTTVPLRSERAREVYERNLILVRPDVHVAWRGNELPDDISALARQVIGALV